MAADVMIVERWRDIALDLCDIIDAGYGPAPERTPPVRLRHGNTPAHDQDDVVYVILERVRTRDATGLGTKCVLVPVLRYRVEVLRAWPADPEMEVDDDAARVLLHDGALVWNGIVSAMQTAAPFDAAPAIGPQEVVVGDLTPIEAAGALAGWRFTIEVDAMLAMINNN